MKIVYTFTMDLQNSKATLLKSYFGVGVLF